MFKPVPVGDRIRYSYARINEVWPMPHLIDIQKSSYDWFIKEGLREIFHDISPIKDFTGNLELSFENFELGKPKYDVEECKERDESYSAPMNVKVRLVYKDTGEIKESSVFMGDFPLMTETGTFVINGAERVIVSQLVRSPGVYYAVNMDPSGKKIYGPITPTTSVKTLHSCTSSVLTMQVLLLLLILTKIAKSSLEMNSPSTISFGWALNPLFAKRVNV